MFIENECLFLLIKVFNNIVVFEKDTILMFLFELKTIKDNGLLSFLSYYTTTWLNEPLLDHLKDEKENVLTNNICENFHSNLDRKLQKNTKLYDLKEVLYEQYKTSSYHYLNESTVHIERHCFIEIGDFSHLLSLFKKRVCDGELKVKKSNNTINSKALEQITPLSILKGNMKMKENF